MIHSRKNTLTLSLSHLASEAFVFAGCSKRPACLCEASFAEPGPARPRIACYVPQGVSLVWGAERT